MKRLPQIASIWLLALVGSSLLYADDAGNGNWVQLFNGKDLKGWTPKVTGHKCGVNFANTFRVEDRLLRVSYDGYKSFDGRFGHLFYNREFSNYRLRVEYRFVGEQLIGGPGAWAIRNSGQQPWKSVVLSR